MTSHSPEFSAHLAALKAIATDVAAANAADVDAKARFPRETIDALRGGFLGAFFGSLGRIDLALTWEAAALGSRPC